jgi:hypothetical protein
MEPESSSFLSILGAVTSTIATAVTAWMAVETRRMAVVARRSVELEHAPLLGISDLRINVGVMGGTEVPVGHGAILSVHVGVVLLNAGRVPVTYKMKSMAATFQGAEPQAGEFLSRAGLILPGSSTVFWA